MLSSKLPRILHVLNRMGTYNPQRSKQKFQRNSFRMKTSTHMTKYMQRSKIEV